MPSLGDRLSPARRRQFVGRAPELEILQTALSAPELSFQVLFIHGPGGVGKTTLLHEYARLCAESEARPYYLDACNFEATPESFLAAPRTVDFSVAEGDRVMQHVSAHGTMKGDFMGMKASGKGATWTESHIVRFAKGKVVEHWANVDQAGMLQQLGFMPSA